MQSQKKNSKCFQGQCVIMYVNTVKRVLGMVLFIFKSIFKKMYMFVGLQIGLMIDLATVSQGNLPKLLTFIN